MLSARTIIYVLALFSAANAVVITAESRDVVLTTPRAVSSNRTVTSLANPPHPFLDVTTISNSPNDGEAVVLAAFTTNVAITTEVCKLGNPYLCVGTAVLGIISTFFLAYKFISNGPVMELRTNAGNVLTLTDARWQAAAGCGIGCQLKAGAALDAWTHFGNMTVNDIQHTMHFYRSGTINGIRAIPVGGSGVAGSKRSDSDDESGIVATYFWDDNNESAYDTFNTDDAEVGISSEIEMYIQSGNYNAICADLEDSTGPLDEGLITIGLNNDVLVPSNLQSNLNECGTLDGL